MFSFLGVAVDLTGFCEMKKNKKKSRRGKQSELKLGRPEELKIEDLHFHDLRHEGTSRLFEAGFSIEQVALVTGHKDWKMLRRYTHLKPEHLHIASVRKAIESQITLPAA